MMQYLVCAIYDSKVGAFCSRFYAFKGEAVRSFSEAVTDGKSAFCKHPADFTLFQLGWFEDGKGELSPDKCPIITAVECGASVLVTGLSRRRPLAGPFLFAGFVDLD